MLANDAGEEREDDFDPDVTDDRDMSGFTDFDPDAPQDGVDPDEADTWLSRRAALSHPPGTPTLASALDM